MRRRADEIVARARTLIGTRFRPQGRTRSGGLDCIGLVALAVGLRTVPADYPLRGGPPGRLARELKSAGFDQVREMQAGDLLALAPAAGQLHLGLFSGTGLIHADAGLGRVVERPLPLPWPVTGIWRS